MTTKMKIKHTHTQTLSGRHLFSQYFARVCPPPALTLSLCWGAGVRARGSGHVRLQLHQAAAFNFNLRGITGPARRGCQSEPAAALLPRGFCGGSISGPRGASEPSLPGRSLVWELPTSEGHTNRKSSPLLLHFLFSAPLEFLPLLL